MRKKLSNGSSSWASSLRTRLCVAIALLGGADGLWAGGLSGVVEDEGVSVIVRDVLQVPATSGNPPLARLGILREVPDGSGRLFVNDLRGPLYVVRNDLVSTYLDLSVLIPSLDTGNLQLGLVSFAFHPQFATNGLFYTAHTEALGATPPNLLPALPAPAIHHAVVTEWEALDPAADVFTGTPRELMRIAAPIRPTISVRSASIRRSNPVIRITGCSI
jgi:hypothetical protein